MTREAERHGQEPRHKHTSQDWSSRRRLTEVHVDADAIVDCGATKKTHLGRSKERLTGIEVLLHRKGIAVQHVWEGGERDSQPGQSASKEADAIGSIPSSSMVAEKLQAREKAEQGNTAAHCGTWKAAEGWGWAGT